MNAAVVVLTLVLVAVVIALVSAPVLRGRRTPASAAENRRAELEAAREAKYRELRDAELDFRTGKMSDRDYELVRGTLRGDAAAILRELDGLGE